MNDIGNSLQRKLASTRRWWRTTRFLAGLAWFIVVVVALALICYHVDRKVVLSPVARETWRVSILFVGLGTLLGALLLPLLRRLPDTALAAAVERRYPALHERLLTTVDLAPALAGGANEAVAIQGGFSAAMTASLAEDTGRATAGLNFRRAVNLKPLRNAGLVAFVMLLLMGADYASAPGAFANWLQRMADPRADIAPFAQTRVWVNPAKEILPRGAGVDVMVTTRGIAVGQCALRFRPDGDTTAAWKTIPLTNPVVAPDSGPDAARVGPGGRTGSVCKFRYHFPSLAQSVTVYASANDGRSNERDVRVEDRPTLLNVRLALHYPSYTRRGTQILETSTGNIAAPPGTEVDVEALANKPLHSAAFLLGNRPAGSWSVSGARAFGHISVRHDGFYALNLVDRHGFDNPASPRYEIKALPDQTPTVQITRPASDMDLVPEGSLPLVAHAADDYGVNSMHLNYDTRRGDPFGAESANSPSVARGSLPLPGPNGTPQANAAVRWHLSGIGPKVGETVNYLVDAVDNDTVDGPHTGRSLTYHVHIVSLTEMQQRLKERLDEEARALAQLREHQIAAQHQLDQARKNADNPALTQAQETQRAVGQEAHSNADRIADLSAQLENNNLATHSELQRRQEAQQTVQTLAQQKIPTAADTVQQAQAPKAPRAQDLASAARQQNDIKHDIEKAQDLLSRTPTPDQLAAEAARLAQEQSRLAESARSLAEDMHGQQQQTHSTALTPEEKAGLQMEQNQQAQANTDTQRLQRQLNQAAQAAQERGQDKTAQALRDAAHALEQGKATAHQQEAQRNLQKNQPANAAPPQEQAARALQEAANQAQKAASPEGEQATAEQLEQTAAQLREMAKEQRAVANQTAQNPSAQQSHQLGQKEQNLQQQANQAQQNLGGAPQAQQSLQHAQQNLNQSGQHLNQNQPQQAHSPAEQAAQQLENAAQQAAQTAEELKQQQAAAELQERIEHLAQVQHGLQSATHRLQDQAQHNQLDSNAQHELGQIAERQKNVEGEAHELAGRFPSPAFQQALQMAAQQMHPATQNLNQDHPDTGQETQRAQAHAARTLDTVAAALKQQAQGAPKPGEPQNAQPPEGAEQAHENAALGELMLAQGLEQQLRQDTGELDQARAHNPNQELNASQQQETRDMASRQHQTQDIARQAGQDLQELPGVAQAVQDATEHMGQAEQHLNQQHTGRPPQGHEEAAIMQLTAAAHAAQQAMQQQQEQAAAAAAAAQGAPQPGQQRGNMPNKSFSRLENPQKGATGMPTGPAGSFGALDPRSQRTLHDGQHDHVPAEYQDLVSRYYRSLAEKQR